jgi:DNA-binding GntR family transcriptional regulator
MLYSLYLIIRWEEPISVSPVRAFQDNSNLLIKDRLAEVLRKEIVAGRLVPGESIVEGQWATRLGVAQASVREALNILANKGFVEKGSGRSARVIKLSRNEVQQLFEVRSVLEGVAARHVAATQPDLQDVDQALADMMAAAETRNVTAYYERDLEFHLLIAQKTSNRFLVQQLRWLLAPLFAFFIMNLQIERDNPLFWKRSIKEHREIIAILRNGDPIAAEKHVVEATQGFFAQTRQYSSPVAVDPKGDSSEVA